MRELSRNSVGFLMIAALAGVACGGSTSSGPSFEVSFDPGLPRSARDEAVRVEVYLVDSCGEVTLGARGVPSIASTFVLKDGDAGSFDFMPTPGDYGLYGVAQDSSCAVVAAGCAPVTLGGESDTLSVTLSGFAGAGCSAGEVCSLQSGECQRGGMGGAGGVGGGAAGGAGGMGGSGGEPIVRVDGGLIVLYEFDEGSGATVRDSSGVAPALDLTIADPGNVTWSSDHLTIDSGTTLSSSGPATKVFSNVVPNEALTVEAWVRPASLVAVGTPPDRIVSMSTDGSNRNFLLGQDAGSYAIRYRTPGENNGNPTIRSSESSASTLLQHLVFTHDADGSEVIYIDGEADTTSVRIGDSSTWDASFPLLVANEATGGREWLGELHLIAIYDRALTAGEVEQNFQAGPE